jgi:two-component system chemotaxis response regulator CheB
MSKIRVLVVDDAVVVRRLLTDALAQDPEVEVVGVAANGRIALQRIPQLNPDVVTLDVEMPEMDGLETLRHLRQQHPRLPVIMFSTLTERGAETTLDALALGARDYVTKPANVGSVTQSLQRVRNDLVPRLKALTARRHAPHAAPPVAPGAAPLRAAAVRPACDPSKAAPAEIVTIGTSTGGPNALAAFFSGLPADWSLPLLIVQHMPPMFTRLLAERLNAQSPLTVVEGAAGMEVLPRHAYVAPGDYHMAVERAGGKVRLTLNQESPENSVRPAADVLFRSVAEVYGARSIAIVLTGMGQDGLRGAERIHAAGGRIFAQDEATSVVWGMPSFIAKTGLAEKVLPLDQVAPELARIVMSQKVGRPSMPASFPAATRIQP